MDINKWAGLVTAASPYALPAGATARQHNLQIRKVGQLVPRQGMGIVHRSRNGAVLGAHRLTGGSSASDKVLLFRESEPVTLDYTLEVLSSAGGSISSTEIFSTPSLPEHRPSFCEDRHGTAYVFFGSGVRPQILRKGDGATLPCGLDAPTIAPTVVGQGDGFFIERVDVLSSGTSYFRPPTLTVSGGSPDRPAEVRAVVQGGAIVAVDILDGGSNYKTMPQITVSNEQVGTGFLALGLIASSEAQYGFSESSTATTSGTYTATWTHAGNVTDFPARIAYRLPGGTTTLYADATFDSSTATPTYTAVIPLGPFVSTPPTTVTTITSGSNQITVSSATNIVVGMELVISQTYFTPNPVVTAVSGNTVTLDRTARASGTGLSEPVSAVPPSGATARITFNSISGAFRLGNTAPTFATGGTLNTTQNVAGGTAYKYYSAQANWYTGTNFNYFEELSGLSGTPPISAAYNRDAFWGLMPAPSGRVFRHNMIGSQSQGVQTYYNFFFPFYGRIGVRMLTGRQSDSATETAWTVTEVKVGPRINNAASIDLTLSPMRKSDGSSYARQPGTRDPVIRIYLAGHPPEWDVDDFYTPFYPETGAASSRYYTPQIGQYRRTRFEDTDPAAASPGSSGGVAPLLSANSGWFYSRNPLDPRLTGALRWYGMSDAGTYPEFLYWNGDFDQGPIVDFCASPDALGYSDSPGYGLGNRTVEIIDPGAQLEKGTRYWIRFEQYNSYNYEYVSRSYFTTWNANDQNFDETTIPANRAYPATGTFANQRKNSFGVTYTDFYFEATDVDTSGSSALLLLPGQVSVAPQISSTGSKWAAGQTAGFTLRQQNPQAANPASTETNSITYTFTAQEIVPKSNTQRIGDIRIISKGSNYFRAPTILSRDGGGYGLRVAPTVSDGQVQFVAVLEGGDGYISSPTLYTSVEPASLLPVLRGTMQGTYRCAYRYADYSQTVVANVNIATTSGSTAATLSAASSLIKPGMKITGHSGIPHMTSIVSVSGTSITLAKAATATVASNVGTAVVRDMELPVTYSDFSPIVDVDADVNGSGRASRMVWSLTGVTPPARADYIEFYRTSGDQSLVFYRLEQYATVSSGITTIVGSDTLSDEELFDIERPNYAALPVVLPNGGLNAFRFGVPRSDMAVAVAYQDRLWYGVSTSGVDTNTVFFSEYDEFESCPDINELPIQNNLRTTDYLTALVPFGSVLLAMQTSHTYSISYNTDPGVDPVVQLQAHRGCLCQQAWDVFDDLLYVADERGIYRMTRSGEVENLSESIRNLFDEGGIDFGFRKNFFLKVDQVAGVLRFFYTPTGVNSQYPTRAVCYHIANKCWWTEGWPNALTCATDYRSVSGRERSVYGSVDGSVYDFTGTRDFAFRDIQSVAITNGGSGYVTPPTVSVTSATGRGAVLRALVTDGSVTDILIVEGGYGYGVLADGVFSSGVTLSISPPPSGTTATATATARHPLSDVNNDDSLPNRTSVGWQVRTGPMALLGEHNAKGGDGLVDRSITVTYQPTPNPKTLLLREYYNNAEYPRSNVMRRDRGTGWVHETSGARSTLDMSATRSALGLSTGQAKAVFAGRSLSDLGSADKHLAVELSCDPTQDNSNNDPAEALIYTLSVSGVADGD